MSENRGSAFVVYEGVNRFSSFSRCQIRLKEVRPYPPESKSSISNATNFCWIGRFKTSITTRMTHGVSTGFSVVSPCTNRHNLNRGNLRQSWCHTFFRDEKLSLEHSQLAECPQTLSVFCRFAQPERTFMIVYISIIYHHSLTASFNPDREALRKPAEAGKRRNIRRSWGFIGWLSNTRPRRRKCRRFGLQKSLYFLPMN